MSVYSWVVNGPNERIAGGYVYLLLCRDEEKIYIKVGQSANPESRFHQLKNGCPVTPRSFSVVPVPGPSFSKKLEASLHEAMKPWRVAGEWFSFSSADKNEFNRRLQIVLAEHSIPLWPMKMTKVSTNYLVELAKKRQQYWKAQYKRRGPAYRDYLRSGGGKS